VPYTSAGKQAIADEEEIFAEIRNALMDGGRSLSRYLAGKRRLYEKRSKMNTLLRYVPETARALARLSNTEQDAIEERLAELITERYHVEQVEEDESDEQ
jgi:DNA topoisomerase-6 subunit B